MQSFTTKDPRTLPEPPRLHWAIILALQILTLGTFALIWLVVQAVWVKRMTGKSTGLIWAIINLCAFPTVVALMVALGATHGLERLLFAALNLTATFTLRSQMEDFPISMPLSGVMTFFFGTIYFQYHLHEYVLPDATDVYGELPAPPSYVPPISPEPAL